MSQSTIFQLCWDGSSCIKPVLSKDKCVLLKDTTQWGWRLRPLGLESKGKNNLFEISGQTLVRPCHPSIAVHRSQIIPFHSNITINDTMSMDLSILYLRGHRSKFLNFKLLLSLKMLFYLSKQCRLTWNAAFCSISSGSTLFAKIPVYWYRE